MRTKLKMKKMLVSCILNVNSCRSFLSLNQSFCLFIFFQDKVGSWYSNPGTGAIESAAVGGGVGKYLKTRNSDAESAATDELLQAVAVAKRRKLGVPVGEFKDFSGW